MQNANFDAIISCLTKDHNPRVWSLLVSVFGDLGQQKGSQISGSLLGQLMQKIGVKPEATRVAIHRLRKEGWINSQRIGRTSTYFLTDWGRTQSAQATPRIYSAGAAAKEAWLVLFDPAHPIQDNDENGTWISSNGLITSQKPGCDHAFVSALPPGVPLPDWMSCKVCEDSTLQLAQDFALALEQISSHLKAVPPLAPIEVAVLRVLLVHNWRRIILRTPILPDHVFPRKWSGPNCRTMIADLLSQNPAPDFDILEIANALF